MVLASEKDAYSDLLKEIDSSYDVGRVSADVRLVPFEENDEPGVPASEVPMSKALRSKSTLCGVAMPGGVAIPGGEDPSVNSSEVGLRGTLAEK